MDTCFGMGVTMVGLKMPGLMMISSGDEDDSVPLADTGLLNGAGDAFVARWRHFAFAVFSADLVWFRRIRSNSSLYSHAWPAF